MKKIAGLLFFMSVVFPLLIFSKELVQIDYLGVMDIYAEHGSDINGWSTGKGFIIKMKNISNLNIPVHWFHSFEFVNVKDNTRRPIPLKAAAAKVQDLSKRYPLIEGTLAPGDIIEGYVPFVFELVDYTYQFSEKEWELRFKIASIGYICKISVEIQEAKDDKERAIEEAKDNKKRELELKQALEKENENIRVAESKFKNKEYEEALRLYRPYMHTFKEDLSKIYPTSQIENHIATSAFEVAKIYLSKSDYEPAVKELKTAKELGYKKEKIDSVSNDIIIRIQKSSDITKAIAVLEYNNDLFDKEYFKSKKVELYLQYADGISNLFEKSNMLMTAYDNNKEGNGEKNNLVKIKLLDILFRISDNYKSSNNFDSISIIYKNIVNIDSKYKDSLYAVMANIYTQSGDSKINSNNFKSADSLYKMAIKYVIDEKGKNNLLKKMFDGKVKEANYWLNETNNVSKYLEAIRCYKSAINIQPNNNEVKDQLEKVALEGGEKYYKSEDYKSAFECYTCIPYNKEAQKMIQKLEKKIRKLEEERK